MADLSVLNLDGTDRDVKDAYVRSLIPSNASTTNKLATIGDISGGSGAITIESIYINNNPGRGMDGSTLAVSKNFTNYDFLLIETFNNDSSTILLNDIQISIIDVNEIPSSGNITIMIAPLSNKCRKLTFNKSRPLEISISRGSTDLGSTYQNSYVIVPYCIKGVKIG